MIPILNLWGLYGMVPTGMIVETVSPGARAFTDEWRSYRPLASLGYCHERVKHGPREYVRGDAHTNGIESLWSMFKRCYMGTYHKMSRAHLHRYVNEFTGRHNIRPLSVYASAAFKAAFVIIVFGVLLIGCIAVIAG